MLLGTRGQPHEVSPESSAEVFVFLFRVDHHHLQASPAVLQEFAHDTDLVEVGFACAGDGTTKFMRVVQRLAPLIDGDRFAVRSDSDQYTRWHKQGVADKRESRGQAATVQGEGPPQLIARL